MSKVQWLIGLLVQDNIRIILHPKKVSFQPRAHIFSIVHPFTHCTHCPHFTHCFPFYHCFPLFPFYPMPPILPIVSLFVIYKRVVKDCFLYELLGFTLWLYPALFASYIITFQLYTRLNLMDKDRFKSHNYAVAACRGGRVFGYLCIQYP